MKGEEGWERGPGERGRKWRKGEGRGGREGEKGGGKRRGRKSERDREMEKGRR